MYLATHEGAIVLRHGGRETVIEAGDSLFIPTAGAQPQPLQQVPEWIQTDGAGPLVTGARDGAAKGQVALPDFADRREPPAGQQPPDSSVPDPEAPAGDPSVQRPVTGTVGGQTPVDLTRGTLEQRGPNDPLPPPGTPMVPSPNNNLPPPGTAAPPNQPPPGTNVPPPPPSNNPPPPRPGGN
jgi:hypothetical protein